MTEVKIGTCGIIILALIVLFGIMMLAPSSVVMANFIGLSSVRGGIAQKS